MKGAKDRSDMELWVQGGGGKMPSCSWRLPSFELSKISSLLNSARQLSTIFLLKFL